ncbi:PIG-L family deacetylase [Micromonospora sp. DSM 115977]|uniref:PIG-L family deacetylase n=1 Tax=Micromonospora reichwaldensis TaxID=3075516 RepID=A0ABU2WRC7_9ACTN|nr:PIG-L family deacetylase [Micromonospora sp. DSM 115977]MDT0528464.1 PIG-L family deacetylase [Micromonospora sp. DSM 115977]
MYAGRTALSRKDTVRRGSAPGVGSAAVSFPASAPALPDVGRALAVFAHPDDAGFGCAGTIATWVAEGADASYLLVTRATPEGAEAPAPR